MLRTKNKVLYPELSYLLYGICFRIHNELGRFRNEMQYADAVEAALKANKIPYEREIYLPQSFEGEKGNRNKVDFIVDDKIILELKARTIVTKEDYFQTKRYLTTCGKKLGLLINFRQKFLTPKRVLN